MTALGRAGGSSRLAGIGIYLFLPVAYVDASSSYLFSEKKHRIQTALGGVYFDGWTIFAALLVWKITEPLSQLNNITLIYIAIGLFRIMFNLFPLLMTDGYWALSEILGMANLRKKSFRLLLSLVPTLGSQWQVAYCTNKEKLVFYAYGGFSLAFLCLWWGMLFRLLYKFVSYVYSGNSEYITATYIPVAVLFGLLIAYSTYKQLQLLKN